jgi:hypothetical protein
MRLCRAGGELEKVRLEGLTRPDLGPPGHPPGASRPRSKGMKRPVRVRLTIRYYRGFRLTGAGFWEQNTTLERVPEPWVEGSPEPATRACESS